MTAQLDKRPKGEGKAIALMYKAILQVSFVSSDFFPGQQGLARAKEIADQALREMNSEHTKLVQKHVFRMGR